MIYLAEYIEPYHRDEAHHFMTLMLRSMPVREGSRTFELEGVEFELTFNKTPMKREANLRMKLGDTFYSCKHLHSKLNAVPRLTANQLTAFILNHKEALETKLEEAAG